jgi:hypothetical protein
VAYDRARRVGFLLYHGHGEGAFAFRLELRQLGRWRFVVEADRAGARRYGSAGRRIGGAGEEPTAACGVGVSWFSDAVGE